MLEEDRTGRYHLAEEHEAFGLIETLGGGTDSQIRGVLARLLQGAGLSGDRAAKVLRCCRSVYYDDLKVDFPAMGIQPAKAPRPRTVPLPVDKRGAQAG